MRSPSAFLASIVVLWIIPLAAAAEVEGPCDGAVTIDGTTYGPDNDTPADPIVVPDRSGLVASWEGSTGSVITDHQGHVDLVIGPGAIRLADWAGENAEQETTAAGSYSVDEALDLLPIDVVGLYELTGSHAGNGGSCRGSVMVLIEGDPLATPLGIGSAVLGVASLVGLGVSLRGKRP